MARTGGHGSRGPRVTGQEPRVSGTNRGPRATGDPELRARGLGPRGTQSCGPGATGHGRQSCGPGATEGPRGHGDHEPGATVGPRGHGSRELGATEGPRGHGDHEPGATEGPRGHGSRELESWATGSRPRGHREFFFFFFSPVGGGAGKVGKVGRVVRGCCVCSFLIIEEDRIVVIKVRRSSAFAPLPLHPLLFSPFRSSPLLFSLLLFPPPPLRSSLLSTSLSVPRSSPLLTRPLPSLVSTRLFSSLSLSTPPLLSPNTSLRYFVSPLLFYPTCFLRSFSLPSMPSVPLLSHLRSPAHLPSIRHSVLLCSPLVLLSLPCAHLLDPHISSAPCFSASLLLPSLPLVLC